MKKTFSLALTTLAIALISPLSYASAIHDTGLFTNSTLAANDDGSTGSTAIGFNINFFGSNYSNLFVNNNGNVTFNAALGIFTPFSLLATATPIIAPFFADVDTRGLGSGLVQYGQNTLGGHAVFGVNWFDVANGVGYFPNGTDKLNQFQLILTDRSDIAAGDFDFEFNYGQIQWETGGASGGTNGLGGSSARAGWSNGLATSFEIAGSAVNGALLDLNSTTGLIHNSLNSNTLGQFIFSVRNGAVQPPSSVPEPGAFLIMMTGMLGLYASRKQRNTWTVFAFGQTYRRA
jgi:PEP-CTERM motif